MTAGKTCFVLLALGTSILVAGCTPAQQLEERVSALPDDFEQTVREAVWAHGNPYAWTEQKNVVIETHWSDYRHGLKPLVNHKIYTVELTGKRMRIDDLTTNTVSFYNGSAWRVFIQGQEIKKPTAFTEETAPYMAMLEYAASEMRIVRTLFCLPFDMLDPGVRLKGLGKVRSRGGSEWEVVRMDFDPNTTGYLPTDRITVYFDPRSDIVDRVFLCLSGEPFYSMPFWGEWADYRRTPDGLLVPHRWEFRRTDDKGASDQGRRLSIVLQKAAFNVDLPGGIFDSVAAKPPTLPDETAASSPLGRIRATPAGPAEIPASNVTGE